MLGGTGKGIFFSGVTQRDVSCILFRRLEKKKLDSIIRFRHNG